MPISLIVICLASLTHAQSDNSTVVITISKFGKVQGAKSLLLTPNTPILIEDNFTDNFPVKLFYPDEDLFWLTKEMLIVSDEIGAKFSLSSKVLRIQWFEGMNSNPNVITIKGKKNISLYIAKLILRIESDVEQFLSPFQKWREAVEY